jgi:hypothetical protein
MFHCTRGTHFNILSRQTIPRLACFGGAAAACHSVALRFVEFGRRRNGEAISRIQRNDFPPSSPQDRFSKVCNFWNSVSSFG